MSSDITLRPQYGRRFQCAGGACEDTCCHGWSIPVDKQTYEKYQLLPAGSIRSVVDTHVSTVPSASTDTLYATIKLTSEKECPFLTAERLCGLQKEHGNDYLSATCSIYPRVLNQVEGQLEVSLYLSCPEAARSVLLDSSFENPDSAVLSPHYRTDQFSRLAQNGEGTPHKPFRYFMQVRSCLVALLRDRNRPLWQRLFLIGMLSKQLDEVSSPEMEDKVPVILKAYHQIIAIGSLRSELAKLPSNPSAQLDIVLRMADLANRSGVSGKRFKECFQDFIDGIGYTSESTPAQDLERYMKAGNTYCGPFLDRHPFVLENYLLNYIFRTLFPFGREASTHFSPKTVFREYIMMASQYVLVHGLLIGISGHLGLSFDEDVVVKTIQAFSKTVEHSPSYQEQILALMEDRRLADMNGIAAILPRF
jgi:lysine-N-methylase